MKPEILALRKLYSSVNTLNDLEKINAYVAAKSLVEQIEECLEDNDVAGRAYALEKLMQSLDDLKIATLPGATPDMANRAVEEAPYKLERFVENIPEEMRPDSN